MNENWVLGSIALIAFVAIGAFLYQCGRELYYWSAAKIFGWTPQEKFDRETRWIDRAVERDRHLARRDAAAASNCERRFTGIFLMTMASGAVALRLGLPWWEIMLIGGAFYAGATMAAGLAWK